MQEPSGQVEIKPGFQTIGACEIEIAPPACIVIFGAYGDLTRRKLVPALFRLCKQNLLPQNFFVFGVDRVEVDRAKYLENMRSAVKDGLPSEYDEEAWADFAERLYYASFDFQVVDTYVEK